MITRIAVAALAACALLPFGVGPASAYGDAEQRFLDTLQGMGVPVEGDQGAKVAIDAGTRACSWTRMGFSDADDVNYLMAGYYTNVADDVIAKTVTAARATLCGPQVSGPGPGPAPKPRTTAAVPADADAIDRDFLTSLRGRGLRITDVDAAGRAIDIGKKACQLRAEGYSYEAASSKLSNEYNDFRTAEVYNIVGGGLLHYCPSLIADS
ncbi:DUF732 domain-containing protein [Mycolicibacterium sp.]|uniref:DUF732 domain-containing protein n=1 Tax=Mycolicibacterium sp. TaxID=2320850 RepID=UPI001A2AF17B|nr:DUF732 domain-containing protein [Mycolicibacterium sp.]MBJ7341618.1 DUF732 domain-containing protein [Mycolicibacterium sp.]